MATLRDEPSSVDLSAAFTHKERPGAILTVSGLAYAITRAEEHMREHVRTSRASTPDIFDTLTATDDCAGAAVYKRYTPTPIPPPPSLDETLVMPLITRLQPMQQVAAPAPILVLDRHAFYHPAGPIPGFAPRPSTGRGALGWAALAMLPLVALVALAVVLVGLRPWQQQVTATLPSAPSKIEAPTPVVVEPPSPVAEVPAEPVILVVDVKTLKAPTKPRARH